MEDDSDTTFSFSDTGESRDFIDFEDDAERVEVRMREVGSGRIDLTGSVREYWTPRK
jgi:hypothetical protein